MHHYDSHLPHNHIFSPHLIPCSRDGLHMRDSYSESLFNPHSHCGTSYKTECLASTLPWNRLHRRRNSGALRFSSPQVIVHGNGFPFLCSIACLLSQLNVLHVQLPVPAYICGHAQVSTASLQHPPRSHLALRLSFNSSQTEAIFHMKLQDLWGK